VGIFDRTSAPKNGAESKTLSVADSNAVGFVESKAVADSKAVSVADSKAVSVAESKVVSVTESKAIGGVDSKTIIADGCLVTGELTTLGMVLLEGQFDGTIKEASSVSVGIRGRMKGTIRAKSVVLSGNVEGVIHCSTLEMLSQARLTGEVYCEQLTVEKGGVLDGRCSQTPFEAVGAA